jgi:hypothetical protein
MPAFSNHPTVILDITRKKHNCGKHLQVQQPVPAKPEPAPAGQTFHAGDIIIAAKTADQG